MLKEQTNKETEILVTHDTQCPFCSVQCKMQLLETKSKHRTSYQMIGKDNPTSKGRLCVKGMHAYQHTLHKDRLSHPLLKVNGEFVPITWEEAYETMTSQVKSIQREDGNDAMAVYGSASITNEEAYVLGKFARVGLRTKHIDYNGRLCMSAAATAASASFGVDRGFTNGLDEIPFSECIVLVGTNLAECQPTLMPYFEEARKHGALIIVVDPRETTTAKLADIHLKLKPGTDAALANGLLKTIIEEGFTDEVFLKERAEGFDDVKAYLASISLATIVNQTGIKEDDLIRAARTFGQARSGMIFTARGIEQQTDGVMAVRNFLNLLIATGKLGKPFSGYGAITGQSNGQGAREHGQKADQLPGYRAIENSEHRSFIADVWGIEATDLPGKGVSAFELFEKMDRKEITGMFLVCSNPVVSNPKADFVKKAIGKLKFFVAVDLFLSETAQLADLVLPTTSFLEDEGTMTNVEGRVTLREASVEPYGESKHDWQIIQDLARALGKEKYFSYTCAEDIFNELRKASKGGIADYYGITYKRLKNGNGILWPCPTLDHPGTPRLFDQTFHRANKKASMVVVPNEAFVPKEAPSPDFPLYLTTGRELAHYLTGVQTRSSPSLLARSFESFMEIHPETAGAYGIQDQSFVQLTSPQGSLVVRARYSDKTRQDTVFVPFHWGGQQNINRLVSANLDPDCRMPGFKVSVVKAEPLKQTR
nr:molybdopterin oxidoreductase family protein [Shouchella patagoniensis]